MKLYDVAVVGATGLVGRKIIQVLEERNFPVGSLRLYASEKSLGKEIFFQNRLVKVELLSPKDFHAHEFVFFAAGAKVSKEFAPIAAKAGAIVIDNSSAFRMEKNIPLVVPEVNPLALLHHNNIIANPNCSTIQMVVALKPLHDKYKIKRIVITTFQSVAGAGQKGIDQLDDELQSIPVRYKKFPHRIAHNILPQVDDFVFDGYTKEEHKMVNETKKIMGDAMIQVSVTCTRVPVYLGHSESVNVEFKKKIDVDEARNILRKEKGIIVVDEPEGNYYPIALMCHDKDEVFVGRIRKDETVKSGLNMWIVADNVRKGAATNAVQIAEELIKV
ncbi:MAG: aspartate-semialdehyde dehydrogenase [Ignavibacteriales bacterium]|nr:aspartate-semialdehyde dehydrogenase [Ignavibacteriales bacterium]